MSTICPAIPIANFYGAGADTWNASAHAALAVAWKVSVTVRTHGTLLALASKTWKLDNLLKKLLEEIRTAVANPQMPSQAITKDQVLEAARTCQQLYRTIDHMYARAKTAGLTNRILVGAALNSVKLRSEEILDIGDALELSVDQSVDAFL